jgi:hypothetical protein
LSTLGAILLYIGVNTPKGACTLKPDHILFAMGDTEELSAAFNKAQSSRWVIAALPVSCGFSAVQSILAAAPNADPANPTNGCRLGSDFASRRPSAARR